MRVIADDVQHLGPAGVSAAKTSPSFKGETSGKLLPGASSQQSLCHLQTGPSFCGEGSPVYVVNDIWTPLCPFPPPAYCPAESLCGIFLSDIV